ncbi:hypothetical protein FRC07_001114 [Ceratobasidium sp. 392]|nr:hypothetical protein FRC07_001114 [Ceratobasidium sp. 392]
MRSFLLLSVVSAVSASSSSSHVPLVRRAHSGISTPESLAAQLHAVDAKYGEHGGKSKVKPRQANSGVPLVNQAADTSYYGIMNLGTPPTPYGVALDTGSSDLWFQSDVCTTCTEGAKIQTKSTSLRRSGAPFSIKYGSGQVGGEIVSDVVQMGGFTMQDQVMGLVNQSTGILMTGQSAGLLGLAFQSLANTQSVPFWEALVSGGQWVEPLMSFWMTRYTNVSTARAEEFGGEFRMGGTNTTLYTGDIEYHDMPATMNSYWMIPLRREGLLLSQQTPLADYTIEISVNGGEPMIITNIGVTSLAAIDTGTTLIGGPPDIVANVYKQIPGSQRGTGDLERYWLYPCNSSPTITFSFDGRAWPMAPSDFKLLTDDPTVCVGSIFEASLGGIGNPDVPQWIIGDAFLKNVYSVFRYNPPSIGFAQLSAFAANGYVGVPPPVQPTVTQSSVAPADTLTGAPPGPLPPSATRSTSSVHSTIAPAVPNGQSGVPISIAARNQLSRILDTGSSDLWLQSPQCAPCTGTRFDPADSSSLQNSSTPFAISYGIGSVKGSIATDSVSIGSSSSGFTVQHQVFGLVNYTNGTPVPGDIAGLMGLGFKNLATSQATPFWEALVSSGKWAEPVMCFWMTRYNNVATTEDAKFGGEFTMGGTNPALYTGGIDYIALPSASSPTFWAIPLQQITVNGQGVSPIAGTLAAIDTATSLIGGPPSAVANIYAAIPNAVRGAGTLEGFWTYPCAQEVTVTLNFGGGRSWPMGSADFGLTTIDPNICVGAIFETTLGDENNPQIPQCHLLVPILALYFYMATVVNDGRAEERLLRIPREVLVPPTLAEVVPAMLPDHRSKKLQPG